MAADDDGLPGQGENEWKAHEGGLLNEEEEIYRRMEQQLKAEQVGVTNSPIYTEFSQTYHRLYRPLSLQEDFLAHQAQAQERIADATQPHEPRPGPAADEQHVNPFDRPQPADTSRRRDAADDVKAGAEVANNPVPAQAQVRPFQRASTLIQIIDPFLTFAPHLGY